LSSIEKDNGNFHLVQRRKLIKLYGCKRITMLGGAVSTSNIGQIELANMFLYYSEFVAIQSLVGTNGMSFQKTRDVNR
jgi:hypothetical protein